MRHVQTHTHKRHETNLTAREGERETQIGSQKGIINDATRKANEL